MTTTSGAGPWLVGPRSSPPMMARRGRGVARRGRTRERPDRSRGVRLRGGGAQMMGAAGPCRPCRSAPIGGQAVAGRELGRLGRGDLVGGDGDLELDLLADQPAALLEGDVPVEAPVVARDLGRRREARRVERRSCPGRCPSSSTSNVTGRVTSRIVRSPVTAYGRRRPGLDRGRDEGDLGELLGVEEVGGAQVRVAGPEVGVHARGRDAELAAGAGRVGSRRARSCRSRRGRCHGRSSPSCAWPRS